MRNMPAHETLRHLHATHRNLDFELKMLSRRGRLSPSEEQRARVIKKEKLRTKDKIRMILDQTSLMA